MKKSLPETQKLKETNYCWFFDQPFYVGEGNNVNYHCQKTGKHREKINLKVQITSQN